MKKILLCIVILSAVGLGIAMTVNQLVDNARKEAKIEAIELTMKLAEVMGEVYKEKGIYVEVLIQELKEPVEKTVENRKIEFYAKMEITPFFEQAKADELKARAGGKLDESPEIKDILKYTYAKVKQRYSKTPELYNASVKIVPDGFNFDQKIETIKHQLDSLSHQMEVLKK